jgi:hypothetical protein
MYGKQKPVSANKKKALCKRAKLSATLSEIYKPGLAEEALSLIKSFDLEDLSFEPDRYSIRVDTIASGALGIHQPSYVASFFGIEDELLKEIAEHIKEEGTDSLSGGDYDVKDVVYDEESGVFREGAGGQEIPNSSIIDDFEWSWDAIEEVANELADQIANAEPVPYPYDDGVWYFGNDENDGDYGLFYSFDLFDEEQRADAQKSE